MGTNCFPLVADLFLFYFEQNFMMSLSDDAQANIMRLLTQLPDIWTTF